MVDAGRINRQVDPNIQQLRTLISGPKDDGRVEHRIPISGNRSLVLVTDANVKVNVKYGDAQATSPSLMERLKAVAAADKQAQAKSKPAVAQARAAAVKPQKAATDWGHKIDKVYKRLVIDSKDRKTGEARFVQLLAKTHSKLKGERKKEFAAAAQAFVADPGREHALSVSNFSRLHKTGVTESMPNKALPDYNKKLSEAYKDLVSNAKNRKSGEVRFVKLLTKYHNKLSGEPKKQFEAAVRAFAEDPGNEHALSASNFDRLQEGLRLR